MNTTQKKRKVNKKYDQRKGRIKTIMPIVKLECTQYGQEVYRISSSMAFGLFYPSTL